MFLDLVVLFMYLNQLIQHEFNFISINSNLNSFRHEEYRGPNLNQLIYFTNLSLLNEYFIPHFIFLNSILSICHLHFIDAK